LTTMSVARMRSRMVDDHAWPVMRPASTRSRTEGLGIRRLATHFSPHWVIASIACLILVTALAQAAFPAVRLTVFTPELAGGSGLISALMGLFGAFVLLLFPIEEYRNRLRWLALVCALLGTAAVFVDVVMPLVKDHHDLTSSIYLSIGSQTLAMVLLCIGFVPNYPPRLSRRVVLCTAIGLGALVLIAVAGADGLPRLTSLATWDASIASDATVHHTFTHWLWLFSAVPLVIGLVAYAGFTRQRPTGGWSRWLSLAVLFIVGSQVHNIVLPSGYSPALTTSRLLGLSWAFMIAIGGVIHIQRLALERNKLLISEREQLQRLNDLASLKADFTSMVAHELGGPVAAVRSLATIADFDDVGREDRSRALRGIKTQANILGTLVRDVQSASGIERDEFAVSFGPFSAAVLLGDAARYAQARFGGDHCLAVQGVLDDQVLVDPDRIRQVLGNLLDNAAKYSPPGTTIRLVMSHTTNGRVLFEVIDEGYGIPEEEMPYIVEKFGRGRDAAGRRLPGLGLGLYVARRILRAHGTELSLRSCPGKGTTASFELEVVE
jgi:signal transduction histidine kinase